MPKILPALAAAGALALGGALVPPAAAVAPDPALLTALQQVIDADSASWSATGGTVDLRCRITLPDIDAFTSRGTVSYAGGGGPVRLDGSALFGSGTSVQYGTGGVPSAYNAFVPAEHPGAAAAATSDLQRQAMLTRQVAAAGRTTTYLTKRYAVQPVVPQVARALARHGVAHPGKWYRLTAKQQPTIPMVHAAFGSLPALTNTGILDAGQVVSLVATPVGDLTRYRGSVELPAEYGDGAVTFVADVTSGSHLSRFVLRGEGELLTTRCVAQLDLHRARVVVPSASGRHGTVVAAEARMLTLVRALSALPVMGSHRARVRLLQGYTYAIVDGVRHSDAPITATESRNGVVLTTVVKGWKYPLRWHLEVDGRRVVFHSVRTT